MIRVTSADYHRPRFGFDADGWRRIVDMAVAYAQSNGGYDWPSGVMPYPMPTNHMLYALYLKPRLLREEWAT
jgi:hypothetical protein